jgi:hypothetical protein
MFINAVLAIRDRARRGTGTQRDVVNHDEGHLTPLDWRNYCWDYGKCLKLINQHVGRE